MVQVLGLARIWAHAATDAFDYEDLARGAALTLDDHRVSLLFYVSAVPEGRPVDASWYKRDLIYHKRDLIYAALTLDDHRVPLLFYDSAEPWYKRDLIYHKRGPKETYYITKET